jgi:hypothetical protein
MFFASPKLANDTAFPINNFTFGQNLFADLQSKSIYAAPCSIGI